MICTMTTYDCLTPLLISSYSSRIIHTGKEHTSASTPKIVKRGKNQEVLVRITATKRKGRDDTDADNEKIGKRKRKSRFIGE